VLFFRIRCVFGQHIILKVSEVKLVTENNEDSSRVFVFCCVCLDPFTKTIDLKRFVNIFLPIQLHKMPF